MIPPGATIGIVGGGQLGRMLALAAAPLGYRCHIYAPGAAPPAAEVAARFTRGAYDDAEALARFADQVDVVTWEFENIAATPLKALAAHALLHPPPRALEIAQDRLAEKTFAAGLGGRPAPFAAVDDRAGLDAALDHVGTPAILKTRRFGYDGKGQARIDTPDAADAAWAALGGAPAVLEGFIAFDGEFSILLCRDAAGAIALWDAPRNEHSGGILRRSSVPAPADFAPAIAKGAALARKIAEALDYVGVLAVEYFVAGGEAVFNEMAPRVHNSGHWTIEGAATSQFENHVRAICGLPLGPTTPTASAIEMTNLIGAEAGQWAGILADPAAHLHLYGKREARPGRKMGHVTRLTRRAEG
jgi:5-(carboxyamino)imidazole ribonucleotide synthase